MQSTATTNCTFRKHDIFENFWFGNVIPGERSYYSAKDYTPFSKAAIKCEDVLKSELSDKGLAALNDMKKAEMSIASLSNSERFIDGFRMGALMTDVLYAETQQNE